MKDKHVFAIFLVIFAVVTISDLFFLCIFRAFQLELYVFAGIGLAGAILAAYFMEQADRFNL